MIDLAEAIHCESYEYYESYEASDRLREQTALPDLTCVFPWCTHSAVRSDMDHVIAYAEGPTATGNIAPACRRHHRAKTYMGWRYDVLGPGIYLWRSPRGRAVPAVHPGTHPLDQLPPGPPPDPLPQAPDTTSYRPAPLMPNGPDGPDESPPVDETPPPF